MVGQYAHPTNAILPRADFHYIILIMTRKAVWNAPATQRDRAVADLDQFDPTVAKPMARRGKQLWKIARRGRPRKPEHQKTRRVVISVDPLLLKRMDAYAKSHGLDRSKLIARGVNEIIGSAA